MSGPNIQDQILTFMRLKKVAILEILLYSMSEICQFFSLFFLENLRHQKVILKLSDLYFMTILTPLCIPFVSIFLLCNMFFFSFCHCTLLPPGFCFWRVKCHPHIFYDHSLFLNTDTNFGNIVNYWMFFRTEKNKHVGKHILYKILMKCLFHIL